MNEQNPSRVSENRLSEPASSTTPRGISPEASEGRSSVERVSRQAQTAPKRVEIVLRIERAEPEGKEDGEHGAEVGERRSDVNELTSEMSQAKVPEIESPAGMPALPAEVAQEAPGPEIGNQKSKIESDPIPARMLNEFVYCPRLFYYEFVEGVFVESADTLRGSAIHQRVDSGSGALPAAAGKSKVQGPKSKVQTGTAVPAASGSETPVPAGGAEIENEVIHSRSVQMGSVRLGVIAKMDLIESKIEGPTRCDGATARRESNVQSPMSEGEESARNVAQASPPASSSGVPPLDQAVNAGRGRPANPQAGTAALQQQQAEFTEDLFSAFEVCPVDYKAGAPKEGADANELWDTDKMQLGLQALILRDNGYICNEGVIYYRATKQRVRLSITPELESWILQNIAEARRVITGPIPAPLVHSPKCVRCSLAPVCLPDETRMLGQVSDVAAEVTRLTSPAAVANQESEKNQSLLTSAATSSGSPRRLIAARDDTRPLYLNTPGLRVGCKDEVLQVKDKDKVIDEVRMRDLSHVALFGNIQISTQAIQALCEMEIPVTYFSMGGWFYGITRGHGLKNVFLRMEQFRLARDTTRCLSLARQFVNGKIRNHRTLLMRNHLEPPEPTILRLKRMSEDALEAASIDELLGIEGAAASQYFQQFNGMIKVADDLAAPTDQRRAKDAKQLAFNFNFANRNRRPPSDPVNAMLSLAYSMLAKDCTLAGLAVGFDPYMGFFHQPRFGRPAFGLDLMEEFRPLVAESTVLSCINNRVITEKDFVRAGEAVNLSAPGRKRFFQTYEQRMSSLITHPLFDYKVSYRRALELQARLLAKTLTGEITEYIPLLTR